MINNSADSLSKKMSLYQLRLVPNRTMTRFEKPWDEIPNNMKIACTPPVHVSSDQTAKQSFISKGGEQCKNPDLAVAHHPQARRGGVLRGTDAKRRARGEAIGGGRHRFLQANVINSR
jgi:hypothetical protein